LAPIVATTVGDLGEKQLIAQVVRSLAPPLAHGIGIGDDAAVLQPPTDAEVVVSTDRVPTDLLALRFGLMSPRDLGAYLAEVNISDIVSMAARPAGLLLNIGVPSDFLVSDFREFLEGFIEAGLSHGAPLIGGDTGYAPVPTYSATALGWIPRDGALRRGGAKPGDTVAVTGSLGGFGAALVYFSSRRAGRVEALPQESERRLLDALVKPKARSDLLAGVLSEAYVSAAMDITDGLGQTLQEFAEAAGAGIDIFAPQIPVDAVALEVANLTGIPLLEILFGIGLELELVLALSPQSPGEIADTAPIGVLTDSREDIRLIDRDGRFAALPGKKWEHFQGDPEDLIAGA
jgi:thiamine-monophosphate kinase